MRWAFTRVLGGVVAALALQLLPATPLEAQGATGAVRGRVVEVGTQRPIADVQVTVEGTTLGAITSATGEFSISNVPSGGRNVVARRLGYTRQAQPVTVTAGGTATVSFALQQAVSQLDAIVVTGTGGAVERRTVGNAITTVNAEEVVSRNTISNVTEVLQGKTPGVTILPGAGTPGAAADIRIRGAGSISGYRPVVYIDGIRANIGDLGGIAATGGGTVGLAQSAQVTSALDVINPNDIESIEVIKGPAAATLYGAEAANGVIQIITKKGNRGQQRTQWGFRTEMGRNQWHLLPEDNYFTCDSTRQAAYFSAPDSIKMYPGCQGVPRNTVIRDNPMRRDPLAYRDGDVTRLSFSGRGGGERYNFYLAGDRDTEQGVFHNSDNSRTSLRANFGFAPNAKTDLQVNVNWVTQRLRQALQDESANGLLLSARRGQPTRRYTANPDRDGWGIQYPASANRYRNFTEPERITLGAAVNFTPFPWFRNTFTAGLDNINTEAQVLFLPGEIDASQDPDASSGANIRRNPSQRILTLDYSGNIRVNATDDIESTTSFGTQVVSDRSEMLGATGIGIGAVDVTLVGLLQRSLGVESFSENNSLGYYLQEQLGWKNRLFATVAVRADDHSSFGTNFDLMIYPKASLSYVISDEPAVAPYLESARINSLKLRGAWGMAGRAPSAYSAPQTYTVDRVTLGAQTGSAIRTNAFGNPDLKPEKGKEIELGFDLGMFDDRIGADFTYYNKRTSDMLQSVSIAPSTGFISSRLTNLGEVSNTGIELGLWATPYASPNVAWDTRVNLSTNRNRLEEFGVPGLFMQSAGTQPYGTVQMHREGYPLGGYWVTPPLRCGIDNPPAGVAIRPCGETGAAMLTATGAAIFNPGDTARRYVGASNPTREIGFSNTITLFRHFRLSALLDYKGGFYNYNYQERNRCLAANDNCARVQDPAMRFPQTAADSASRVARELAVYRSTGNPSPEWIEKADFIKLREVSLSIDLPQFLVQRARVQSGRLILSGRNLAVWSDYSGADPEVNSYGGRNFVRIDAYAAPMMRRMSAAIDLQF